MFCYYCIKLTTILSFVYRNALSYDSFVLLVLL